MHEEFMLCALEQAKLSAETDEVPIGAVIVKTDRLLQRRTIRVISLKTR